MVLLVQDNIYKNQKKKKHGWPGIINEEAHR